MKMLNKLIVKRNCVKSLLARYRGDFPHRRERRRSKQGEWREAA
jgi:hypothetical protein